MKTHCHPQAVAADGYFAANASGSQTGAKPFGGVGLMLGPSPAEVSCRGRTSANGKSVFKTAMLAERAEYSRGLVLFTGTAIDGQHHRGQEDALKPEYFFRLADAVRGLETDPATATDPIKRTFLCDGQDVSCNVNILEDGADVIHIQPDHDELVLVLEGRCGFRVGEEIRRVEKGDLMFIPRDTVHGPIIDSGRVALLSIFAPFFDRTKKNIRWSRDEFA